MRSTKKAMIKIMKQKSSILLVETKKDTCNLKFIQRIDVHKNKLVNVSQPFEKFLKVPKKAIKFPKNRKQKKDRRIYAFL